MTRRGTFEHPPTRSNWSTCSAPEQAFVSALLARSMVRSPQDIGTGGQENTSSLLDLDGFMMFLFFFGWVGECSDSIEFLVDFHGFSVSFVRKARGLNLYEFLNASIWMRRDMQNMRQLGLPSASVGAPLRSVNHRWVQTLHGTNIFTIPTESTVYRKVLRVNGQNASPISRVWDW